MTREQQKQALIDLRGQLCGALHRQPFTIYKDETIEDLVKAQPKTLMELEKVKGFPKNGKRITGFGETIIKIFNSSDVVTPNVVTDADGNVKVEAVKKLNIF